MTIALLQPENESCTTCQHSISSGNVLRCVRMGGSPVQFGYWCPRYVGPHDELEVSPDPFLKFETTHMVVKLDGGEAPPGFGPGMRPV